VEPERWRRVEELYHSSLRIGGDQRAAFLKDACRGDLKLCEEVESLLAYESSAKEFMETPAFEIAAKQMAGDEADENQADPVPIGATLQRFRVIEKLGVGGMGVVYKAEDTRLHRTVALKFLPKRLARDPASLERFEREAHSASALNHPNICTVYDVGDYEGQPFIAMELLEGQTLDRRIAGQPLPAEEWLNLGSQIAEGLHAAHQKGIIHRDIKPANIFVTSEGQAKILDFGLAKLLPAVTVIGVDSEGDLGGDGTTETSVRMEGQPTPDPFLSRTGVAMGTAGYMSPEQARGEKLDARTDLFSFGLVLYEMATGKRAFTGDTGPELHAAILSQVPQPARTLNPKLPARFDEIIRKALEKDREKRYQSAAELNTDLENLRLDLLPKAHTLRWLGATAGIMAVLLVSTVVWVKNRPRPTMPNPKLRQLTFNSPENPVRGGAISPDGKYLAYVDTKGIHVLSVDTGEVRAIPPPDLLKGTEVNWEILHYFWFPDSSRFIANAHPARESETEWSSGTSSIWMFAVNGGAPHKVRDNALGWSVSPDGSSIAFGANKGKYGDREIWLMGPTGEQARKLFDAGGDNCLAVLIWRPDGQRVIYVRSEASCQGDAGKDTLVSSDLKGGPAFTVFPPSEMNNVQDISWLPDGRLIYGVKEPQGVSASATANFWTVQLDPRTGQPIEKPTRLTNWGGFSLDCTGATANGRRLAFLEYGGHGTVYVADLLAGGTRIRNSRQFTLGEDTYIEGWTPDSKTILFGANRAGTFTIYKQSLDSDESEVLAGTEIGFRQARVSPDGKWVMAYRHPKPGGPSDPEQLMRIPFAGGSPELIFTGNPPGAISCTNQAANLCVLARKTEDHKQLIVAAFDPVKGWGRELARFASDPNTKEQWFDWQISPDGTRLAAKEDGHIHILSLRGHPEQVIQQPKGLKITDYFWAADSRGLYAGGPGMGKTVLLLLDLQGNTHVVWEASGNDNTWGAPSPDGRHLAFLGWTNNRNMWMMESF
jgi:serine/threonine protein kinase